LANSVTEASQAAQQIMAAADSRKRHGQIALAIQNIEHHPPNRGGDAASRTATKDLNDLAQRLSTTVDRSVQG